MYVDIDMIKTFNIDIEREIIQAYTNRTSDIIRIINMIRVENAKRTENDKIDTKSKYDLWAIKFDLPTCDELMESGFDDFAKLFSLDIKTYLSWTELKKLCKEYQAKYTDARPIEIYHIMKNENKKMVEIKMLAQIYEEYNSMRDLFNISL